MGIKLHCTSIFSMQWFFLFFAWNFYTCSWEKIELFFWIKIAVIFRQYFVVDVLLFTNQQRFSTFVKLVFLYVRFSLKDPLDSMYLLGLRFVRNFWNIPHTLMICWHPNARLVLPGILVILHLTNTLPLPATFSLCNSLFKVHLWLFVFDAVKGITWAHQL